MRFYQHNLGDWAAHTQYLDWMELAAYHKLIEVYYLSEQALPGDLFAIYRIISAITKQEREATRNVLNKFFTREVDGLWHQKRCDEEIERQLKVSDLQRKKINKRWQDRPIDANRITEGSGLLDCVKKGVHASIDRVIQDHPPRPIATVNGHQSAYRGNTPVIPPVIPPMNHELIQNNTPAFVAINSRAREAAEECVSRGIEVQPQEPRLLALLADGATPADFAAAAPIATAAGRGWAYCAGIVANRLSDAARMPREGTKTGSGSPNYPMLPRWDDP